MKRKINIIITLCFVITFSLLFNNNTILNNNNETKNLNNVETTTLYADGDTFNDGTLKYTVISEEEKTVGVDGFLNSAFDGVDLTIPNNVTYNGYEYKVSIISENAFSGDVINKVVIPENIIEIKSKAFLGCGITLVEISNNSQLNTIGVQAFQANAFTSIYLPESLETIEANAFIKCNSLNTIYFNGTFTDSIKNELAKTEIDDQTNIIPRKIIVSQNNYEEVKGYFNNEYITVSYELNLTLDLNGGVIDDTTDEFVLTMLKGLYGYEKTTTGEWKENVLFELPVPERNESFLFEYYKDLSKDKIADKDHLNSLIEDTTLTAQYKTNKLTLLGDLTGSITIDSDNWFASNEIITIEETNSEDFPLLTSDIVLNAYNISSNLNSTLPIGSYFVEIEYSLESTETYKIYTNSGELSYDYLDGVISFEIDTLTSFCIVKEGMFTFDTEDKSIGLNRNYLGEISNIVIPSTFTFKDVMYNVEGISLSGFNDSRIESLVLPDSLTSISGYAFNSTIKILEIPAGVTTIDTNAFVNVKANIYLLGEITSGNLTSLVAARGAIVIVLKQNYDKAIDEEIMTEGVNIHYIVEITLDLDGGTIESDTTLYFLSGERASVKEDGIWSIADDFADFAIPTKGVHYEFITYTLADGTYVNESTSFTESQTIYALYKTNLLEFEDFNLQLESDQWFDINGEMRVEDASLTDSYLLTSDIILAGVVVTWIPFGYYTLDTPNYTVTISLEINSNKAYKVYLNGDKIDFTKANNSITIETNVLGTLYVIEEGLYSFDITTNEISINDNYKGDISNLVIPSEFVFQGTTYDVTGIKENSFNDSSIKEVTLPDSLITINAGAFSDSGLTSIVLPTSLLTIGGGAFSNVKLNSLTIPSNVVTIGNGAFSGCTDIIIYMNAVLTDTNTSALASLNTVVIVPQSNYEENSSIEKLTYELTTTLDLDNDTNNVVIKRLFGLNDYVYTNGTWVEGKISFTTPTKGDTYKFAHFELDGKIITVDTLLTTDSTIKAIYYTNTIIIEGKVTIVTSDWFELGFDITITDALKDSYTNLLAENDVINTVLNLTSLSRTTAEYTITFHLSDLEEKGNYQVFMINDKNELVNLETTRNGNDVTFTTTTLGEFAVVKVAKVYFFTNYTNLEWTLLIVIAVLALYNILAFVIGSKLSNKNKKAKEMKMSSTLIPLLMIAINHSLIYIIIAYLLAATAVVLSVRIIYYFVKNIKSNKPEKVKKEKVKKEKPVKTNDDEIKKIDETDLIKVIEENQSLKQVEDNKQIESNVDNLPLKEVEANLALKEIEEEPVLQEIPTVLKEVVEETKVEAKEENKVETIEEEIDDSIEIVEEIKSDDRELLEITDFDDTEEETEEEIETEVEEDPTELVKAKKDEQGRMIIIRYKKSYSAKLNLSEDVVKDIHNLIKNKLLSYSKVKSRVSWNYDAFNLGRAQAAKLSVRGKSLFLYLPIDPKEYEDSKYTFKDCSDIKKYEQLPFRIKLKSSRSIKHACELIDMAMTDLETKEIKEFETVNYYQKNRGFDKLLEEGLIKEVIDAETFKGLTEINKEFLDSNNIKSIDLEVIKDIKISDSVYKEVVSNIETKGSARDVINVDTISKAFEDGEVVSLKSLKAKKLIPANSKGVKCLARGTLDKCLTFELQAYSKDAIKMILITNGKIK